MYPEQHKATTSIHISIIIFNHRILKISNTDYFITIAKQQVPQAV